MRKYITSFMLQFLVSLVFAQALPTGESLMDKFVEITGGKEAYAKLHNRKVVAGIELKGSGITFKVTSYHARPHKMVVITESPLTGNMAAGVSDSVAWDFSVKNGPHVSTGKAAQKAILEATFDQVGDWRTMYVNAKYIGKVEIEGYPCHKVELETVTHDKRYYYFAEATGLLVRIDMFVASKGEEVPVIAMLEDYRSVDGILYNYKKTITMNDQTRMMYVESVEHNLNIDERTFDVPLQVKAIMGKKTKR